MIGTPLSVFRGMRSSLGKKKAADHWDTLYKNLDKQPSSPGVPVAQRLEHPTSITEVVGSIPAWDSDFFSVVLSPVAKQLAYIILTAYYTITIINNH